jgi:hypothetical protein
MNKTVIQFQQGDVLIWSEAIPADATRRESRVVAVGEVTGHAHRIEGDAEMFERDGVLYFRVIGEARQTHEEHDHIRFTRDGERTVVQRIDAAAVLDYPAVEVPSTEFRFGSIVEYDYWKQATRNVVD